MGDFVQGSSGGNAQLCFAQTGQWSKGDFQQCEDGAHDGDDGHGHHFVVGFFILFFRRYFDGARQSHDGRTANAGAARHQNGELRVDAKFAGDGVAHHDGECHDHGRDGQTLDALGEQYGQIELESEQNDSQTQQFIGNKSCCVLHAGPVFHGTAGIPFANRKLGRHADEQCDDQRAEQTESRKLFKPRSH